MVQTNAEKDPNEMGDTTDNQSPKKQQKGEKQQRTGKGLNCEIVLLDGEHVHFEVDRNADGRDLFDKVCQHLDLIEKDYFGIQYVDERLPNRLKCWLSPDKKISKQKKGGPLLFDFALKFYPPDPTQLRESLTRWLVVLQTRRDILSGKLPTTFLTQAMLGSYCVQADVGDFDPSEHRGIEYIRDTSFAPNQTADLLEKIVELHKQHKGQTPDEAEINFLENAKKLSMYGVDLHEAQDANNVDITLGVCASGLQVYREKLRISRFVWPKILKICYKRRHFYVKVRPSEDLPTDNTVSFKLASHRLAKRLWKICVEHHAFFRLREAEQSQNAAMFPRLGSKFRYSGRTLYQTRQNSQILDRPDPYFERSQPARNTFAAPTNRSRSVDEISNRPDHWKDDEDYKKRPDGKDEKDRKDLKDDDPYATATRPGREDMRPLGSEEGGALEPGANKSMDGKDRLDRKPGDDDATLEREGAEGMMGLTAAELQKKAKEDEKERKKREKEEEKRRKKEEEERKKAEKAAKKGKGKGGEPSAEDRKDVTAGGDNTEKALGRTPGSHGDQEGKRMKGLWCFGQDGPRRGRRSSDQDGHDQYSASEQSDSAEEGQGRNRHGPEKEAKKHRLTRGKKQGEQDNSVDNKKGGKKRGYTEKTGDGYKDRRGLGRGPRSSAGPGRDGDREHQGPGSTERRDRHILETDQNGELHPENKGRKNKPHVTREDQSRRILAGGLLGTGPVSEGPMKGDDESSDRDRNGEKSFEKSSESETSDSSTSDSDEDQQLNESKENRYTGKRGKDAKGKVDKHKGKGKDAKKRGKDEKKKGKDADKRRKVDQSKKGKSKDRDMRDEDDTDEDESRKRDSNEHGRGNKDMTGKGKEADRHEDEDLDTSSEGTDRDVDSSDDDYSEGYEKGRDKDAYKHGKLKGKKEKDKKEDKHGKEKGRKEKNKDADKHGKVKDKDADKHGKVKDKDGDKHGKVKDKDADKHGKVKDKDADKHGKDKDKDADKHGKVKDKDADKHGKVKDKDADKHGKVKDKDADKHGKDKDKDAYKHGTDRDADKDRKDRDGDRHGKDKDADKHGKVKDKDADKHGKDKDAYKHGTDRDADKYRKDRDADRHGKDKDADKHGKDKDADRYGKDRDADKYGKDKGTDKHGKDKDKDADRHGKDKDKDADRHGKDKKADKHGKDKDRTDKDKDAGRHWKHTDKDAGKHGKDKDKDTDEDESDASTHGKDIDKDAGKHGKDKKADKHGKDKDRTEKDKDAGRHWKHTDKDAGKHGKDKSKDTDEDESDASTHGKDADKKAGKHGKDKSKDADKRGKDKNTDKHRKDKGRNAEKLLKDSDEDADKHLKDSDEDADKHGKGKGTDKHRKDREKDADKHGKGKAADKHGKDRGKDADKYEKDEGKVSDKHGKDRGKDADKHGKDRGKDADKHGKDKGKDADKYGKGEGKDTDKHGKSTKKGGFFSMFKKPRDSRQSEDEAHASPGRAAREQEYRTAPGRYPDDADGGSTLQGSMYPSFGPGLLTDGGDMSGVVGEETWIDNKLKFEPIVPPKKETKDSLKSVHGIDHTMPYFSPDATSTVGRPGKGGPPIPPKINSFDDSYDRTDVYKNNKDGIQETRVQHTVVLSSADDEDFDYDAALADAIRSVTEFNPDMSVERIECVQQIEDARDK